MQTENISDFLTGLAPGSGAGLSTQPTAPGGGRDHPPRHRAQPENQYPPRVPVDNRRGRTYKIGTVARLALVGLALFVLPLTVVAGTPVTDNDLIGVSQNVNANTAAQLDVSRQQLALQTQQLQQLGSPSQYVNLLQLAPFTQSAQNLKQGVGTTPSQVLQTASGSTAISYTGQGLYTDLSQLQGQNGSAFPLNQDSFKRYAVVQNMYANYQAQLQNYNAQMSSLQDQLVTAMNNLNQASTQIETLKYQAQVNGINALVTALASQMNALGQGIIVQHIANENDAARVTQAIQQKRMSDRLIQTSQAVSTINALLSRAPGSGTSIQP